MGATHPKLLVSVWLAFGLAALAIGFATAGVSAHANAVRTAPPADAVVVDAPGEIGVWFDAAVDPAASGLTLMDRAGRARRRA